jgi:hypothetical protein
VILYDHSPKTVKKGLQGNTNLTDHDGRLELCGYVIAFADRANVATLQLGRSIRNDIQNTAAIGQVHLLNNSSEVISILLRTNIGLVEKEKNRSAGKELGAQLLLKRFESGMSSVHDVPHYVNGIITTGRMIVKEGVCTLYEFLVMTML